MRLASRWSKEFNAYPRGPEIESVAQTYHEDRVKKLRFCCQSTRWSVLPNLVARGALVTLTSSLNLRNVMGCAGLVTHPYSGRCTGSMVDAG